eukprot:c14967_g1_i1.p1 GENE.c14967_g1_i1~~c14967_g1_i1.p1  ORF type:complete len:456 (-),score=28.09 c14967_g1_i1:573-1940(-)
MAAFPMPHMGAHLDTLGRSSRTWTSTDTVLWPQNSTISVSFADYSSAPGVRSRVPGLLGGLFDNHLPNAIFSVFTEIVDTTLLATLFRSTKCNLTFVRNDPGALDPRAHGPFGSIHVGFCDGGTSWSTLGRTSVNFALEGTPTMMFSLADMNGTWESFKGTIRHEVMHALGFEHEHQDNRFPIIWDRRKVFGSYLRLLGIGIIQDIINSVRPLWRCASGATPSDDQIIRGLVECVLEAHTQLTDTHGLYSRNLAENHELVPRLTGALLRYLDPAGALVAAAVAEHLAVAHDCACQNIFIRPTDDEVHLNARRLDEHSIMLYRIPSSWVQNVEMPEAKRFVNKVNLDLSSTDRSCVVRLYSRWNPYFVLGVSLAAVATVALAFATHRSGVPSRFADYLVEKVSDAFASSSPTRTNTAVVVREPGLGVQLDSLTSAGAVAGAAAAARAAASAVSKKN